MTRFLDRIEREMNRTPRTPRQERIRRVSIILLLIAIPLVGAELGLRLAGFHRPQIDFKVQQKLLHQAVQALNARFQTDAFEFDPHLLWKLTPGKNLDGIDVNSRGLLDWTHPTNSSPRQLRPLKVLCLGDSVTAITYKTYPEIAERLATAGGISRAVEVYNAAVPGYSTSQALRQISGLKDLQPDVVVLCFGWNDHFPALSLPDRDLGVANAVTQRLHDWLKDVRLYQLIGSPFVTKLHDDAPEIDEAGPSQKSRVPLTQFRQNLAELIGVIRSWPAVPILATQPENLRDGEERFLENNHFILSPTSDNRALHSAYNQVVRETSFDSKIPLLDLQEEFARRPREYMMEPDGIHLTGRGHNHVARLILAALRNEGMITAGDYDSIAKAEKHDTTAPDKPKITWTLIPEQLAAPAGQAVAFTAIPQNSGNTRWLAQNVIPRFGKKTNVSYGSTSLFTRWRTRNAPTTGTLQKTPLKSDVLPGEATSVTLMLQTPPVPGNYELEVGLMCDHIGPLTAYGADSTTLTVTSVQP